MCVIHFNENNMLYQFNNYTLTYNNNNILFNFTTPSI